MLKSNIISMFDEKISGVVKNGFLLSFLNIAAGVFGYVYQIMMGVMMPQQDFASFASIMAVCALFTAPFGALTLLISRSVSNLVVSQNEKKLRSYYFSFAIDIALWSAIFWTILYFSLDLFESILKVKSHVTSFIFSYYIVMCCFVALNLGFFQGLKRFWLLGGAGVVNVLLKLFISVLFVFSGIYLNGALLGVFISASVTVVLGIFFLNNLLPKGEKFSKIKIGYSNSKEYLPILVASTTFTVMAQSDLIMVNWFYSGELVGSYAAASTLGKAVLYLPNGIAMALFPVIAEEHLKNNSGAKHFIHASIATLLFSIIAGACYFVFSNEIIYLFFGNKYPESPEILKWYGFSMVPLTMVLVAEQYLMAKGRALFAWLFMLSAPIQLVAIYFFHGDIINILIIIGITGLALTIIGYTYIYEKYVKK